MTEERILLVDDDPHLLSALRRHLGDEFALTTAGNGRDAIDTVRTAMTAHTPFAVVLCDMRMPGMDGIETLAAIRDVAPDTVRIMLTGNADFLEGAEKGTEYLRDHMRFYDQDEELIYWYHGLKLGADGKETKLLTSEFGDDYDSIPMYEQIYALAGPTQTYRVTGDKKIMWDIEHTIKLFEKFYKD
ncbi:MAG: response regulator, partial [Alphaproteobacteria bacterium]|nr:response regulator [Alphaproteobacteria bacterium]